MPVSINGQTGAVTGLAALPDSAMASGSIIQVVSVKNTTQVSTTTTSLTNPADSGMSVTLTPSSASNKILVMIHSSIRGDGGSSYANAMIKRNGTLIDYNSATYKGMLDYAFNHIAGHSSWCFEDTPNSTSAVTYGFFFSRYGGSGTTYFNNNGSNLSCSTMTAMEVAA